MGDILPDDIIWEVALKLDYNDLLHFAQISRRHERITRPIRSAWNEIRRREEADYMMEEYLQSLTENVVLNYLKRRRFEELFPVIFTHEDLEQVYAEFHAKMEEQFPEVKIPPLNMELVAKFHQMVGILRDGDVYRINIESFIDRDAYLEFIEELVTSLTGSDHLYITYSNEQSFILNRLYDYYLTPSEAELAEAQEYYDQR